jgi:hypothetical protein
MFFFLPSIYLGVYLIKNPYLETETVTKTNTITKSLNAILKPHFNLEERKSIIRQILIKFKGSNIQYRLPNNQFLILTTNERIVNKLRRYPKSPFPLLINVENFSNNVGEFNKDLQEYGIKTREKLQDHPNNRESVGNNIYLVNYQTLNSKGNRYLRKQYHRLENYRKISKTNSYWALS